MNVRGERILIFGDSLTHHGADNGPETWDVNAGSSRSSSAPGDLLASMLLEQGASAVRTNARVGRSAANFYERENASDLLAADRAWRPTKVVIMLGTNDLGRAFDKTTAAMAGLKNAYEGMGAEVWAVGPFTYNNGSLNAQAPEVVQIMHNVFGARFIDGRPLSIQTGRASDGVHFGAASAKQTAINIGNALMSTRGSPEILGALALGAGLAVAAIGLFKIFSDPTPKPRRQMMSGLFGQLLLDGPPVEKVPPIDVEADDDDWGSPEWMKRLDARRAKRDNILLRALEQNDAVIMTLKHGRRVLLVKSGEMQNTDEGSIRVTEFDDDGPIGHMTRKSLDKLAADIMRDWHPDTVEPASEAEVMAIMSTERFAEGSRRVAEVQKHNAGLKGGQAPKDPAVMRASEINKELDRLDAKRDKLGDEMIAAGRGHERPSEYLRMTDPLSMKLREISDRQARLRGEIERRYGPGAPRRLPPRFGPIRSLGAVEGYRVAYVLVTKRGPLRAVVDAPRPLTLAEAEKWRRKWGKSDTAWIETMDGELVPVKGAKRAGKFVDDAKPGDVHWTLTR